jgi:hypothetical protein
VEDYERRTLGGGGFKRSFYISDADSRHDQRYQNVNAKYGGDIPTCEREWTRLRARIPLSLEQIEKLGIVKRTGQFSHRML